MEFTLTNADPLNTTFLDVFGRVHYRVVTKYNMLFRPAESTIFVYRWGISSAAVLAKIRWKKVMTPTIIEYRGREFRRNDYLFKKRLFGLCSRFTALDGLPYEWVTANWLRDLRLESESSDGTRNLIARSRRSSLVGAEATKSASLEISPTGLRILDDIILTFTCMDQARRECVPDIRC